MKAKLLTISLMVGLFMGCHDFLDVKPVGKLIPTEVEEFENKTEQNCLISEIGRAHV